MIKFRERSSTMWNATFSETGPSSLCKGLFILVKACIGLISLSLSMKCFQLPSKFPQYVFDLFMWWPRSARQYLPTNSTNTVGRHLKQDLNRFTLFIACHKKAICLCVWADILCIRQTLCYLFETVHIALRSMMGHRHAVVSNFPLWSDPNCVVHSDF